MIELSLTFKQYIIQRVLSENELRSADLLIGRFQPFHAGHAAIIENMNNPVIVIIKGKKTSEDRENNPLSAETQEQLIKTVYPKAHVFISNESGFLPAIIGMVKEHGFLIKRAFAGADRIGDYRGQVERENKKVEAGQSEHKKLDVSFVETPRVASATAVRESIRSDNYSKFKSLMPSQLAGKEVFSKMKQLF